MLLLLLLCPFTPLFILNILHNQHKHWRFFTFFILNRPLVLRIGNVRFTRMNIGLLRMLRMREGG